MGPNRPQWAQMDPNWVQMDPNWAQMDPNGPKWIQIRVKLHPTYVNLKFDVLPLTSARHCSWKHVVCPRPQSMMHTSHPCLSPRLVGRSSMWMQQQQPAAMGRKASHSTRWKLLLALQQLLLEMMLLLVHPFDLVGGCLASPYEYVMLFI